MTEAAANGTPGSFDLEQARAALTSSSTNARIAQLRAIDEKISQKCELPCFRIECCKGNQADLHCAPALDRTSTLGVLKVLFWTHAFYIDRPSRQAVQRCLVSLCQIGDADILTPLVAAVRQETQKQGIAADSAFVLVEWCSLLTQNFAGTPLWDKFGKDIILATADSLEKCLQPVAKSTIGSSALVITRRGLRKLALADQKAIDAAIQALAAKGAQPVAKNAVLLGAIAGVCSRKAEVKPVVEGLKSQYYTFYTREIVGSRTPVPAHLADGLRDFFSAFASLEDLDKEVFPALEKGLLRAPEVVLNDLITPLVRSLPGFDLSQALSSRFIKPLLSNIKSSNAAIRSGAVNAFKAIASTCQDFALLEKVADEVLGPLKTGKLASADHRVLHSEMLVALPASADIAKKVAAGLPAIVGKEANEAALSAETLALNASTLPLLRGDEAPKPLLDAYAKGLADKKIPVRRIWILRAGDLLRSIADDAQTNLPKGAVAFAEAVVPPLLSTFDEVVANPTAAAQSGLVTGALVVCGLGPLLSRLESGSVQALLKKAAIQKNSLAVEPKPSYLLNQRIYSKLPEDDLKWLCRALCTIAPALGSSTEAARVAWAQAYIFLICSVTTSPAVRRQAIDSLSNLCAQSEGAAVASEIINGMWHWIEATEVAEKESAAALAKSGNTNLHLVLQAVCLSPREYADRAGSEPDKAQIESRMCSLLVLAKPQLIPRSSWIDLCLRVGLDPGDLARRYEEPLIQEIVARTVFGQKVIRIPFPSPKLSFPGRPY
jgi:hypothetical protein